MQIHLKIIEIKPRKLACGDMQYRIVLEGIEGGLYADEMHELIKRMEEGKYILVTDIEDKNHDEPRVA
jgi:hypothetical protein